MSLFCQIMNCGIVGLPNVGKSTIFSALSAAPAEAANYPFCTIEPNVGVVMVPDVRLDRIHKLISADRKVNAVIEFVDIAGLVPGSSRGEGLGNRFLAHIREVGIIAHVVRCFGDDDVVHVQGRVDPVSDMEMVNLELCLADLQALERRTEKNQRALKSSVGKERQEAEARAGLFRQATDWLAEGRPLRSMEMVEGQRLHLQGLLSLKKQIYVCNVSEQGLKDEPDEVIAVRSVAEAEGADVVVLCGKLEADIASIDDPEERAVFLEEAGSGSSGLERLVALSYRVLGLGTFFTCGGVENRAWTFRDGSLAPECAGTIHSDFQRGFICAEVYACDDLFELGSEAALRSAGRLRTEGRNYTVSDGDVMHFRFNV